MKFSLANLKAAREHSTDHREELQRSEVCGCFYCCSTFVAPDVEEWLDEGQGTALCPNCGVDSVIGSASGYPVGAKDFLRVMHQLWFG
jgi:hypothetical protein